MTSRKGEIFDSITTPVVRCSLCKRRASSQTREAIPDTSDKEIKAVKITDNKSATQNTANQSNVTSTEVVRSRKVGNVTLKTKSSSANAVRNRVREGGRSMTTDLPAKTNSIVTAGSTTKERAQCSVRKSGVSVTAGPSAAKITSLIPIRSSQARTTDGSSTTAVINSQDERSRQVQM